MLKQVRDWARSGAFAAVLGVFAAVAPDVGHAAWLKAETDRFVVYSEVREKDLVDFATRLATFDAMLRSVHKDTGQASETGKLDVFLLRGAAQMKRVRPQSSTMMRGYYMANPKGVYAVAVRTDGLMTSDEVLFHEYMHRFMLETFPAAYPGWLIEAYAEYFQTASIKPDHIDLGNYSEARAYSLLEESWLPWNDILKKSAMEVDPRQRSIYYAQAWMLLHYMLGDSARTRQLDVAIKAIANGEDPVAAFHKATGMDEAALNKALRAYMTAKLVVRRAKNPFSTPPAVTISRLPPSADALLLESKRLIEGVPQADQAQFIQLVRTQAARYPDDPFAELTLARTEAAYGEPATARTIVERWLAKELESVEVLRAAADIHMTAAERDRERRNDHLRAARPYLAKAYQKDPNDFRILFNYAYARTIEPGFPTDNEINVLLRARRLAPSVDAISMFAGQALMHRGRRDEARVLLLPVANDPHGGEMSAQARKLLNTGMAGLKAPSLESLTPAD